MPIFSTGTSVLSLEEKVIALLRPYPLERICQTVPKNVSNNVTFLLNVSGCKVWEDWKCDEMGSWRNNGVKRDTFIHENGNVKSTNRSEIVHDGTMYTLVCMYYKNRTSRDLKKCVTYLQGIPHFLYVRFAND